MPAAWVIASMLCSSQPEAVRIRVPRRERKARETGGEGRAVVIAGIALSETKKVERIVAELRKMF